jgi:hypothetical protein
MKKRILIVPLDERPCNYNFSHQMFNTEDVIIDRIPFEYMGFKKKKGNIEKINEYILSNYYKYDGMIVSIDTLLYGGIVPSRIHFEKYEDLIERLNILRIIKEKKKELKIFAFNLVMRCPRYNDDDEEPEYYKYEGENIFYKGYYEHKIELNEITEDELNDYKRRTVTEENLNDYLNRRSINNQVTRHVVGLVNEKVIDFLIVPQDDSAPYGYTVTDQLKVRKEVEKYKLHFKVLSYPGADEVCNTLTCRMVLSFYNKKPLVYIKYPSCTSMMVIPSLEDRYLDTSLKYQIIAAGCLVTDNLNECDLVFAVNAPALSWMMPSSHQEVRHSGYTLNRNLVEFVEFIDYAINVKNKLVTIGDIGFDNGSDLELISMLEEKELTLKLAGYASWNIPCNSLGTALPFGVSTLINGFDLRWKTFLVHRYLEDTGYCGYVKWKIRKNECSKAPYTIFDCKEMRGFISKRIEEEINEFIKEKIPSISNLYEIEDLYLPWIRTYEIGLKIKLK